MSYPRSLVGAHFPPKSWVMVVRTCGAEMLNLSSVRELARCGNQAMPHPVIAIRTSVPASALSLVRMAITG